MRMIRVKKEFIMKVEGLGKVFVYRICTAIIWIIGIVIFAATFFTNNFAVITIAAVAVIGLCAFLSIVFKLKEYKLLIGNDERRTVELTKTLVLRQALWSIVVNIFNVIPILVLIFVITMGIITVMGEAVGTIVGGIISSALMALYTLPLTVSNLNRIVYTGEFKLMCGPKSIKQVYATLDKRVTYICVAVPLVTSLVSALSGSTIDPTGPVIQGFGVVAVIGMVLAIIIDVYTSCLLLVKSGDCFNE